MIDDKDDQIHQADVGAPENEPHDFEEEFDFDVNEDLDAQEPPPPPPGSERSKLPLIIGLAVIGFIGWKAYRVMFPPVPDAELAKIAIQEEAAIKGTQAVPGLPVPALPVEAPKLAPEPVPAIEPAAAPVNMAPQTPAPVARPVPAPAPVVTMPATPAPTATAPQTTETRVNTYTQEEIKNLENTVSQVMDSLNKMDQKMSLIGREFFAVSDNVSKLSEEMAQIKSNKATTAKKPAPVAKPKARPRPQPQPQSQPVYEVYEEEREAPRASNITAPCHELDLCDEQPKKAKSAKVELVIHAVIPGRVWLRTPEGTTQTFIQGETIPGYGKVMVIDAPSSTVVTSSGVVLR